MAVAEEVYALEREKQLQRSRARFRTNDLGPMPPPSFSTEVEARNLQDTAYFIHEFCKIDEPQAHNLEQATASVGSKEKTVLPFHLWPKQVEALGKILANRFAIILKARQLGLSWLVCAYALWLCIYRPGQNILIFSRSKPEAIEMARRISVMFGRLPQWLRDQHPLAKDGVTELIWENGSRVRALASTKEAGRSFTGSLVIMDEAAFIDHADDLYNAFKPTIDAGGQLIVISTFNQIDDFFDKLWLAAIKKLNRFIPIFLAWTARPGRTAQWYEMVAREAVSMAHHLREYPSTWEEARQTISSEPYLPSMTFWDPGCKDTIPAQHGTLVLAADGASAAGGDSFGLIGVGRHPLIEDMLVVYHVRKWQAMPGDPPLDFTEIEDEIIKYCRTHRVLHIAYDPHGLHQMLGEGSRIKRAGIDTQEFKQGGDRLEADKGLLDKILQAKIMHNGDADLTQHLKNADRLVDKEGKKLRIVKRNASEKIDLAVALSMAAHRATELWSGGIGTLGLGSAKGWGFQDKR